MELCVFETIFNKVYPVPDLENLTEMDTLNTFGCINTKIMTRTIFVINENKLYIAASFIGNLLI